MLLYHLTTDLKHDGKFEPRIPQNRGIGENSTTPRVCTASSLDGCFTAYPRYTTMDEFNKDNKGLYKVFCVDTKKLKIPNKAIIDPMALYYDGLVGDSTITGEHWITCPFVVPEEDSQIIYVGDYETVCSDEAVAPLEYAVKAKEAGVDIYDFMVEADLEDLMECLLVIQNVDYVSSRSSELEIFCSELQRVELEEILSLEYPQAKYELIHDNLQVDFSAYGGAGNFIVDVANIMHQEF